MQLSYGFQTAVLVITALAGTAFVLSLLLLFWSATGDSSMQEFVNSSIFYTGVSGVVTVVGLLILKLSKSRQA